MSILVWSFPKPQLVTVRSDHAEVSDLFSLALSPPSRVAFVPADVAGFAAEGRRLHQGQSGLDLLHPDFASAGGAHLQHSLHSHQGEEGSGAEPWFHAN